MPETFPNYPVSRGSGPRTKARVLEKRFGDGYTQTAADGLNNLGIEFRAIFNTRLTAEIAEIEAFLIRHGGHRPFLFTLPTEADPRRWRCKAWTGPTRISAAYSSLTATLIEDFSL